MGSSSSCATVRSWYTGGLSGALALAFGRFEGPRSGRPGEADIVFDDRVRPDGNPSWGGQIELLVTLVESAGETIPKEKLIARTWPDTVVDEGALRVHVAALRKALGDGRAGKRYIANNPGRGYAFVAPVRREQRQETAALPNRPGLVAISPHS